MLELVDGWDLGRVLHRRGAAARAAAAELACTSRPRSARLAYAHAKTEAGNPLGIVHRDVSPHNILVSEQGEVKLTDFGIAKAMNKREHTGTGVVKGKVSSCRRSRRWASRSIARSDLFSMGTVLYQ